MMQTILSCLSILLMAVVTASADQLDFNNLQIGEEVLGYYNGGFGSLGTGPGPSFGITFTSDFVTVAQGVFGPPFQGEELTGTSGIMDVVPGFSGPFSFYYTNSGPDGTVNLYSGLDGGGSLLGTIALPTAATFNAAGEIELVPFESAVFTGTPRCTCVRQHYFRCVGDSRTLFNKSLGARAAGCLVGWPEALAADAPLTRSR